MWMPCGWSCSAVRARRCWRRILWKLSWAPTAVGSRRLPITCPRLRAESRGAPGPPCWGDRPGCRPQGILPAGAAADGERLALHARVPIPTAGLKRWRPTQMAALLAVLPAPACGAQRHRAGGDRVVGGCAHRQPHRGGGRRLNYPRTGLFVRLLDAGLAPRTEGAHPAVHDLHMVCGPLPQGSGKRWSRACGLRPIWAWGLRSVGSQVAVGRAVRGRRAICGRGPRARAGPSGVGPGGRPRRTVVRSGWWREHMVLRPGSPSVWPRRCALTSAAGRLEPPRLGSDRLLGDVGTVSVGGAALVARLRCAAGAGRACF